MKILVLVKQVPETDSLAIDPETGTVVRSEATSIVNPLDLYALEAALAIKDARAEARITALSMGPPAAAVALKEAVAMGCDDAVLVTGREFAGADTWATARTLAAAIRRLGPFDLVFCGEKATDGDTGQVGPEVAAFLDLPVVTYAGAVELRDGPEGLVVRAELGAQPPDVDVDRTGAAEVVVPPDLLQQLGPGEHPARMLREVLEQLELLVGQVE